MKLATHLRSWVNENQVTVDNQMPFYKLGSSKPPVPEPNYFLLTPSILKMAPASNLGNTFPMT